ncbi:hypothetical protein [Enterococcus sp. DIV0800]|uniref:LexA family protein n=1 Tax=unclassified Enterococcus TaxID=2608891 RepID=UPI003D2FED11
MNQNIEQFFVDLKNLVEKQSYAPSVREVMEASSMASVSKTYDYLNELRLNGLIHWEVGKNRTLVLTEKGKVFMRDE